jgi:hypothetical protein
VVLVLDGAYAEFNTDPNFEDGLSLARNAHNIIVTHTFSKMHGLAALRVVDASVFPTVTSGNTLAPTLMVAERGADLVLADQR